MERDADVEREYFNGRDAKHGGWHDPWHQEGVEGLFQDLNAAVQVDTVVLVGVVLNFGNFADEKKLHTFFGECNILSSIY